MPEPTESSLATLVDRYFGEVATFSEAELKTDEECHALAAATYEATLREIAGVPARTPQDALAAFDFLIREEVFEEGTGIGNFGPAVESMVQAIRSHLASQV